MNGETMMALLATNLLTHFTNNPPARIVTRELMDFAQRKDSDLATGVVSVAGIVLDGLDSVRELQDMAGRFRIILVGQFKLGETSTGLQVEQAEWALWEQVKAFCKAPGAGLCPLSPVRMQLSGQVHKPYGEIVVDLDYQELE
jgi:hypothetical protein